MELLGIVPGFDKTIAHRICSGLVGAHVVEVESCAGKSVLNMVDDRSLDGALVATNVGAHQLPHFLLPVGRGLPKLWSVEDTRFLVGLVASLSLAEVEARVFAGEACGLGELLLSLLSLFGSRDKLWVDLLFLSTELLLLLSGDGLHHLHLWLDVIDFCVFCLLIVETRGLLLDSGLLLLGCFLSLSSLFLRHLSKCK